MDKRKIRTILLVVMTIAIFCLSYYICINKLKSTAMKNNNYKVNSQENQDSLTANAGLNQTVSAGSKVVFQIKYTKSGDIIVEKEEPAVDLVGKNKSQIDEIYKNYGYKAEKINPSEAVLIKEVDLYAPNKYVLGIKDQFIAIYRTDKDGNMYIENEARDVTDIKIDRLKQADIQLLEKGDKYFQCDTREDAEARLEDYE